MSPYSSPPLAAEAVAELLDADGHLYVFGYGSLIWKPGFSHASRHPALLRGFHRRFCIWSRLYRGTPEQPGLVLGLKQGGACRGAVFRVPAEEAGVAMAYLDAREMVGGVYVRRLVPVRLLDGAAGATRRAVAYIAARDNPAFCPDLTPAEIAAVIARGQGNMGANRDYLLNTIEGLAAMGVRDRGLARLADLLGVNQL